MRGIADIVPIFLCIRHTIWNSTWKWRQIWNFCNLDLECETWNGDFCVYNNIQKIEKEKDRKLRSKKREETVIIQWKIYSWDCVCLITECREMKRWRKWISSRKFSTSTFQHAQMKSCKSISYEIKVIAMK